MRSLFGNPFHFLLYSNGSDPPDGPGGGEPDDPTQPSVSAYATVDDIAEELRRTVDGTSKPTDLKVQDILNDIAAEIEGVVRKAGYKTPVSDETFLKVLRQYNIYGACARVENIYFADASPNQSPRAEMWYRMYQDGLKKIMSRIIGGVQSFDTSSSSARLPRALWTTDTSAAEDDLKVTRAMKF